jgi:hypothetical protein
VLLRLDDCKQLHVHTCGSVPAGTATVTCRLRGASMVLGLKVYSNDPKNGSDGLTCVVERSLT